MIPGPAQATGPTCRSALEETWLRLSQADVPTSRLDAELLIAHVLGHSRTELYTSGDRPLRAAELERLARLLDRRSSGEPIAYLLGQKEFWSLELEVHPGVLIPRPETERVVEVLLGALEDRPSTFVVDVGTGSGAIALAVKTERPQARVLGVDCSIIAVETARRNGARHGLSVELAESFLLGKVVEPASAIVSNPPYIRSAELATLGRELSFEPRLALDGGPDGLAILGRLIAEAPSHLTPGGLLVLEIGADQAAEVSALIETSSRYETPWVTQDLAGKDRVVAARLAR